MRTDLISLRLERAMRSSARWHVGQTRKGNDIPYFEHAAAVAMILDRAGFNEDVVIAGLLHDVVEDTDATLADVEAGFGAAVAEIVGLCSEMKYDAKGRKRPWIDRKRDHLAALAGASALAWAVILADKLHNLACIELDLAEGRPVWGLFNADRAQVLWYYRATIDGRTAGDPRLEALAAACRAGLDRIEARGAADPGDLRSDGINA
jgi:guanosine-3',5'-bis(diphosphate) 3'-pyrophosphohydrolase